MSRRAAADDDYNRFAVYHPWLKEHVLERGLYTQDVVMTREGLGTTIRKPS